MTDHDAIIELQLMLRTMERGFHKRRFDGLAAMRRMEAVNHAISRCRQTDNTPAGTPAATEAQECQAGKPGPHNI